MNSAFNSLFDLVLAPLERIGPRTALVVASGIFGVLALVAFKYISWQRGIKAAKDRIKGHMIAIRLYQDDLRIVGVSVAKVLARNAQYLGLNFGPIVPLAFPFLVLTAQLVVRYAYDPLPVHAAESDVMPGRGTLLEIELAPGHEADVKGLRVTLPDGLQAVSPLVRAATEGRAFQEFVAVRPGEHEIVLELGSARETKLVVAGDTPSRAMQPRRVSSRDWMSMSDTERWPLLWPAEEPFASDSPFRVVAISYPSRDLGWMPGGEFGILLTVAVASMLFGAAALKPLGVQI